MHTTQSVRVMADCLIPVATEMNHRDDERVLKDCKRVLKDYGRI